MLIKVAKYKMKDLEKYRTEMTKAELDEVFRRKAVWGDGPTATSAIWKAQVFDHKEPEKIQFVYVTNTHRAMATAPTLKGAIKKFQFIKTTA